jgi:hypothetical protein
MADTVQENSSKESGYTTNNARNLDHYESSIICARFFMQCALSKYLI